MGRPLRGRHCGDRAQDDQGARWDAEDPRAGSPTRPAPERVAHEPYLVAELEDVPDAIPDSPEVEALTRNVQGHFARIIGLAPYLPEELQLAAANVDDPSALAHLVARRCARSTEERQALLETVDVEQRLRQISVILNRELEVFELGSKIQSQVQSEMEKGQREYFLRQQLKAIQRRARRGRPEQAEVNELRERIEALTLPDDARRLPTASWPGSSACRRPRPSTA